MKKKIILISNLKNEDALKIKTAQNNEDDLKNTDKPKIEDDLKKLSFRPRLNIFCISFIYAST